MACFWGPESDLVQFVNGSWCKSKKCGWRGGVSADTPLQQRSDSGTQICVFYAKVVMLGHLLLSVVLPVSSYVDKRPRNYTFKVLKSNSHDCCLVKRFKIIGAFKFAFSVQSKCLTKVKLESAEQV